MTRSSTPTERRDELARITNGYSPAMIEQICSMALTSPTPTGGWSSLAGTSSRR